MNATRVPQWLWLPRVAAAGILLQTLFFKFQYAPETQYIFETVGLGKLGAYGTGVVELVAAVLFLLPLSGQLAWMGGLLAAGTLSGAIFFHLTKLGIEVQGDGGQLFYMAIVVFLCSVIILLVQRHQPLALVQKVLKK